MLKYGVVEVPGTRTVDYKDQDAQDNTPRSLGQGSPGRRRQSSAVGSPLTQAGSSGPSRLSQPGSGSTLVGEISKTESEKLRDKERELANRGLPSPSERGNYANELKNHLESSPLCPLHASYTASAKGYCPYHPS